MESKELELEIKKIRELLIEKNENPELLQVKNPSNFLIFEQSPVAEIDSMTLAYDNYFYVIDKGGVLHKYEDIKTDAPPLKSSSWQIDGEVVFIVVTPQGYTLFVNSDRQAQIYHTSGMESQPEKLYESNTNSRSLFLNNFGVKSYYNGISSIILAGVYGSGPEHRDLLLSLDGGESFNVIKQTINLDLSTDYNSHWHDVEIDVYGGYLWASEGDGPINRRVHYSDDLGSTWRTIEGEQPTAIASFSDRVVFGRDNNRLGIDYTIRPTTVAEMREGNMVIESLQEFRDWASYKFYGRSPVTKGDEGYIGFYLYDDSVAPIVIGTGDGGISWHGLFLSNENIGSLIAVDDDSLYAYNAENDMVLFAKKPNWI